MLGLTCSEGGADKVARLPKGWTGPVSTSGIRAPQGARIISSHPIAAMAITHPGLSQTDVVEILAACPSLRPREHSLTEFHSLLAESLASTSSRLAKRVLTF